MISAPQRRRGLGLALPAMLVGLFIGLLGACSAEVEPRSESAGASQAGGANQAELAADEQLDLGIEILTAAEAEAEARASINEDNADEQFQKLLEELAADG